MHHAIHLPYTLIKEQRTNEKYCDLLCRSFIFNFFFSICLLYKLSSLRKSDIYFVFVGYSAGLLRFSWTSHTQFLLKNVVVLLCPVSQPQKPGTAKKKNVVEEDRSSKRDRAKEKKKRPRSFIIAAQAVPCVHLYVALCRSVLCIPRDVKARATKTGTIDMERD